VGGERTPVVVDGEDPVIDVDVGVEDFAYLRR